MKHRNILLTLLAAVLLLALLLSACSFVPEEIKALETAAETAEAVGTAETEAAAEARHIDPLPGSPIWPWILGEAVILAGLAAFFVLRHRKKQQEDKAE